MFESLTENPLYGFNDVASGVSESIRFQIVVED